MASAHYAEAIFFAVILSPTYGACTGVQSLAGGKACPTGVFSEGEWVKSNMRQNKERCQSKNSRHKWSLLR
jgi:hypothetical protein